MTTFPTPRPGILDIAPYVGGESKIPGIDRPIRLASNESPLGPSRKAIEAYSALAPEIHRYPDGGSTELRRALARHYGLDAERIVCGAGSDELITLLTRAYAGPGDEVLYSRHGFLMYPIAAKSAGATPVSAPETNLTADVDALLAKVNDRTRIVFLANPNNPTGTYLSRDAVKRLHAGLPPHVLLVIDAAYAEYVVRNDYEPGIELVEAHKNVVMCRTFSKIYALGGMRIGWAYCSAEIADVLNRVRNPFNVNAAAQAAAVAALEDVAATDRAREHNDIWLPWLARELENLGLEVNPSVGNFLLVRFADADAAWSHLQKNGIIVRKMGAYGLSDRLRITVGTESENRAVVATLAGFLGR
ncbi:MAG: histidinol-phosphate transaminase [Rhodospirillales bacterium]|nr:histidinol-phosphate transaminase [Rhodospirillales bacterium]